MRRFLTGMVAFLTLATQVLAAGQVKVTPSNMNGWHGGTYSPYGTTSAGWYLGTKLGVQHIGNGAVWFYTGAADGIAYMETINYKGTRLSQIGRMAYHTYTGFTGLSLSNVAPILALNVDTNGDSKGDTWLMYSPELNNPLIPRNTWTRWETTEGLWWSNKQGPSQLKQMRVWMQEIGDATIDGVRIQAGTWDRDTAGLWFDSWYGADLVISDATNSGHTEFDFEPDAPSPVGVGTEPKPLGIPEVNIKAIPVVKPPWIIDGPNSAQPKTLAGESIWRTPGFIYVPLMFQANWTLKELLSQIEPNRQSPDPVFTAGGAFVLGGVPFYIREDPRKNIYSPWFFNDDSEHSLTIDAGVYGAVEVYTVITCLGGDDKQGLLFLEFRTQEGQRFTTELRGNKEVRGWSGGPQVTNNLLNPARPVWGRRIYRLDSQKFVMPLDFQWQHLASVRLIDKGFNRKNQRGMSHRAVLVGVTVKAKA